MLILVLLEVLISATQFILKKLATFVWLPVHLWSRICDGICSYSCPNVYFAWLHIPIRWAFQSILPLLFLGSLFFPPIFVYGYFSPGGRLYAFIAALFLLAFIIFLLIVESAGFGLSSRELFGMIESFFISQLEMLGFLSTLVTLFGITRTMDLFVAMSELAVNHDVYLKISMIGFVGLLTTILDYFVSAFMLIILICGIRVPHVYRHLQYNKYPNSTFMFFKVGEVHWFIIRQAIYSMIDVFLISLGAVVGLITFHRYKTFWSEMLQADVLDRKKIAIMAIINLVDIPFMIMFLLVLPTWRGYFLYKRAMENNKGLSRGLIFEEFVALLLDIPMAFCFLVVRVTFYRYKLTMDELNKGKYQHFLRFHVIILRSGLRVFVDVFIHVLLGLPMVITMWRARTLWKAWRETTVDKMNAAVLHVFSVWLLDIPAALCFLVVLLTGYRMGTLMRKLKTTGKDENQQGTYFYIAAFSTFVSLLIDIPYVVFGLLSLWRIPYLIWLILKKYSNETERREAAKSQMIEMLIDIPFVISVVLLVASIMHIIFLISGYKKAKKGDITTRHYRLKAITLAASLPLQVPFILCTYLIVLTGYRVKTTYRLAKQFRENRPRILIYQTLALGADVGAVVCSFILGITVYRASELIEIMKTRSWIDDGIIEINNQQKKITVAKRVNSSNRANAIELEDKESKSQEQITMKGFTLKSILSMQIEIYRLFWHLIRDIPILILIIVSSFTIWRIGFISKLFKEEKDYNKRLIALCLSSILTLLDIPMIVVCLLLLISWRSSNMYTILHQRFAGNVSISLHYSVFHEFYELLIDIPYALLAIITAWRLPYILFKMCKTHSAIERRAFIVDQAKDYLTDIPYVFLLIIHIVTLYRIRYYITFAHRCFKPSKSMNKYSITFKEFILYQTKQLFQDLPIISFLLVTNILLPWRFITLIKILFFEASDSSRRKKLVSSLANSIVDVCMMLYAALILGTVYRIPITIYKIVKGKHTISKTLHQQCMAIYSDILNLLQLSFMAFVLHRFPTTVMRLYSFFTYSVKTWWRTPKPKPKGNQNKPKYGNGEILPPELLMEMFMHLSGTDVAQCVEPVCKYWNQISHRNTVWNVLYYYFTNNHKMAKEERESELRKAFAFAFTEGSKKQYVKEYESTRKPKKIKRLTPVEKDYIIGFRAVINDEFYKTNHTIVSGILSLPLRFLFPLVSPIYFIMRITSPTTTLSLQWNNLHHSTIHAILQFLHFLWSSLFDLPLNLLILFITVVTFGYPLWGVDWIAWSLNRKLCRFVIEIISVLASPVVIVVSLAILVGPWIYPVRSIFQEYVFNFVYGGEIGSSIEFIFAKYFSVYNLLPRWANIILLPHIWNCKLQLFGMRWAVRIIAFVLHIIFYWDRIKALAFLAFTTILAVKTYEQYSKFAQEAILAPHIAILFAVGLIYYIYCNILISLAKFFSVFSILGDIIMIGVTLTWILFPLIVPYFTGIGALYIPAVILVGFLLYQSLSVLRRKNFISIW